MNREGEMKTVEEYQADMGDYASEKATMVLRQALSDMRDACANVPKLKDTINAEYAEIISQIYEIEIK